MIRLVGEMTARKGQQYCFEVHNGGPGTSVFVVAGGREIHPSVSFDPGSRSIKYCFMVPKTADSIEILVTAANGTRQALTVFVK